MWPLIVAVTFDSAVVRRIHVAPAETLSVTIAGSGTTVVLVPGLFGSAYGFREIIRLLNQAGFRTIVIEPLAVGRSSRPRRADYSLQAQAVRIARVLDSLGVDGAVLVGHSLGAAMVMRVAVTRPDLAAAVVSLEGGPAESATSPSFRRAMRLAPFIKLAGGMRLVRRSVRDNLVRASGNSAWITDELIAEYTAGAAADLNATLLAYVQMGQAHEREPLGHRLAEMRCPMRLLLGGAPHGSAPPAEDVARLERGVPQLEVVTIEGAGHFLHEEAPRAVALQIIEVGRAILVVGIR